MPRDPATGIYTAPDGTTAIPGAYITDEQFNNFVADVSAELTGSAREAEVRDEGGVSTTTGTGAAYFLQLATPWATVPNGQPFAFRAHTANTGACTIKVNGGAAVPLRPVSGVDFSAGDIAANAIYAATNGPTSFSATFTGNLTANSNQVTGVSSVTGLAAGQTFVAGVAGIPTGTTITSVTGSTLTLSAPFAGVSTNGANCTATGAEVLVVNGGSLALAKRLAAVGGVALNTISATGTLDSTSKGKVNLVTGSPTLTFDQLLNSAPNPGWSGYLVNAGSGDVTLQTTPRLTTTASLTQGSNAVINVPSTTNLAVGQAVTGPSSTVSFTGTPLPGLAAITAVSSITGLVAGAVVSADTALVAPGTTIVGTAAGVIATGTTTSGTPTITGLSTVAGLAVGATVTATSSADLGGAIVTSISGSTVTLNKATVSSASGTSFTFSPVVTLSANLPGAGAAASFSATAGWPIGTTVASITSSTAFTTSNVWAGTTTASATIQAYDDLIDGLTTYIMYPGEARIIGCDAAKYRSVVLAKFLRVWTASGFYVHPPGYPSIGTRAIGSGAGGMSGAFISSGNGGSLGGGGGACSDPIVISGIAAGTVVPVRVAAGGIGGAAGTSGAPGGAGSPSSFGPYTLGAGGKAGTASGAGTIAGPAGGTSMGGAAGNGGAGGGIAGSAPQPGGDTFTGGGGGGAAGNDYYNGAASGGGVGGAAIPGSGTGPMGISSAAGLAGANAVNGFGAQGGSGGGRNASFVGLRGGDGGAPGGGGGAGGSGNSAVNCGAGGNGGRGEVRAWGL